MNPEITYYKNGQIESETWRNDARELHRLDGPAVRWWYTMERLRVESWCINDQLHRLDGPARRTWHTNGQLENESWYLNDVRHRLDGPAFREWHDNGQLGWEFWYINGVNYNTEAEFRVAVDLYKANEIAELF